MANKTGIAWANKTHERSSSAMLSHSAMYDHRGFKTGTSAKGEIDTLKRKASSLERKIAKRQALGKSVKTESDLLARTVNRIVHLGTLYYDKPAIVDAEPMYPLPAPHTIYVEPERTLFGKEKGKRVPLATPRYCQEPNTLDSYLEAAKAGSSENKLAHARKMRQREIV